MTHQVLLFYKYVTIANPAALREEILARATELTLTGRILIAEEGINATVEGAKDSTEAFADFIHSLPGFGDIQIKRSPGTGAAFPKLSVKVRPQIVGTRFSKEDADPEHKTAPHISPEQLRQWYEEGREFEVVDMRNDYEYASGHFRNSVNPGLENSRDLPNAIPTLAPLKEKTVVTVCTGGIRCESMSAYLMNKGFTDVYQLDGGIHTYMEKFPGKDFEGTLYTFDQRLVMDFGADPETGSRAVVGTCRLCGTQTEDYTNCANLLCHLHFLACSNCRDAEGNAYCGESCRTVLAA